MARKPSATKGPRPKQGKHLLALRQAASLSQVELADALGVSRANIAYWEWSKSPPRSDVLPKMAKVFGVRVEDLIVQSTSANKTGHLAKRPGPVGEVQRTFEEVRKLPRTQQKKIADMVNAIVEQYERRASGE